MSWSPLPLLCNDRVRRAKGSCLLLQWLHRVSHFNPVGIALKAFSNFFKTIPNLVMTFSCYLQMIGWQVTLFCARRESLFYRTKRPFLDVLGLGISDPWQNRMIEQMK
jgi:hypothetical protein